MTGAELQAARLRLDWTVRQAAEAAELSPSTVRALEAERRTPGAGDYASGRKRRRSAYKLGVALGLVEPMPKPERIALSADARVLLCLACERPGQSAAAIAPCTGDTDRGARQTLRRLLAAGVVSRIEKQPRTEDGAAYAPVLWSLNL